MIESEELAQLVEDKFGVFPRNQIRFYCAVILIN